MYGPGSDSGMAQELSSWHAIADVGEVIRERHLSPTSLSSPSISVESMSPMLDHLSLEFVIDSRTISGQLLDMGCGEGLATLAALGRGGRVTAVDPDAAALQRLKERVPPEQQSRLQALAGSLPSVDFGVGEFSGIHVAHVLHFLNGREVEVSLRKFARWLSPRGRLYLSVLTPLGSFWESFHEEFIRRSNLGARWPGYLGDCSQLHLFNEQILRRELEAVGFQIEKSKYYAVSWDRQQLCCALVARRVE